MKFIYDKKGIPIHIGDLIKIYHFTAALRREKNYMYKHVKSITEYDFGTMYVLDHLGEDPKTFAVRAEDEIVPHWEVIQGFNGGHFSERRKLNAEMGGSSLSEDSPNCLVDHKG